MRYKEILNKMIKIKIYNTLNKGVCMYNYKFDDGVTKKVIDSYQSKLNEKSMDDLIKKVADAKSTFETADIPEYQAPNFERMNEVHKTTEEIKAEAEHSLSDYKNSTLNEINNDYSSGVDKIKFEKEQLQKSSEDSKESISKYFNDARQSSSDNALKRGLSRSSIVINQLNAFDKDELNAYMTIDKELTDNLNALDFELNTLNLQKEQALSNFDIAYAVKLTDKINKINEDLLEEQNKVLKYNNEIAEKELKYKAQYDELISDIKNENIDKDAKMVDMIAKYGKQVVDTYKQNKIFKVLDDYFAGMSNMEITEAIFTNEKLKSVLGDDLQVVLERYK